MNKILIDEATVKLVLEVLGKSRSRIVEQGGSGWKLHAQQCVNATAALQKALAEQPAQQVPLQKPAAVVSSCTGAGDKGVRVKWLGGFPQIGDRLYTTPQAQPAPVQQPVASLLAAIQAEPVTLIHKSRAMELVKDYTPQPAQRKVGDSRFESWISGDYDPKKGTKQQLREAYEAGMNDPLVQAAPVPAQQEPVGTVKELFSQAAWEKVDVKGSTKVYLHAAPQPAQTAGKSELETVPAKGGLLTEQPAQQEPVADELIRQYINSLVSNKPDEAANVTKAMVDYVYTTPQPAQQEPVGSLSVRYFRGSKSMTNTDFDYYGDLPEGDYELYTNPQAQTQPVNHSCWADMAANGLQWVRNIVDGVSDPVVALANLEENLELCEKSSTARPAQRKPLTDEEIENIFNNWPTYHFDYEDFARAIEAAHGIKEKS